MNRIATVKDLREFLEGLSDDMPIIKSKDDEGNGYNYVWLNDMGVEYFFKDGEYRIDGWLDSEMLDDEYDGDVPDGAIEAVLL